MGGVVIECERGDSNPHVLGTLDPKSGASAEVATPAGVVLGLAWELLAHGDVCGSGISPHRS